MGRLAKGEGLLLNVLRVHPATAELSVSFD